MRTIILMTAMLVATGAGAQNAAAVNPPGDALPPAPSPPPAPPTMPTIRVVPAVPTAADKYRTDVVCKSTIETGSLIARHKTCLTRKQWQYVNDENERNARKLVEDNMGRPTSK